MSAALALRSKVFQAEEMMRQMPQLDLPVHHHFSDGVYGRELVIPKGTMLTGHIHKGYQLNVLLCGDISVLTEDGVKRVRPPFVVVSPPGTKRIAYAHEDSRWLTVHGTLSTDLEIIEEQFIAKSEAEYLAFVETLRLEDKCPGQP